MMNTISDLNNYLFETLERISDSVTDEEMDREIKRSKAISSVATAIIHNGQLALDTMKHLNEYGYNSDNKNLAPVPVMLQEKKQEKKANE